ncbi:LysR substrate-binding domain-containing protein [Chromobacterium sphagni]|nr:LysR substrate-binding domain-containing protein [Chromobacterium sphagni]
MPTDAAHALRLHAEEMESVAATLARTAAKQGDGITGVVRVTASEVIGVEVLPPIIAALRDQHPGLKVELALSNRMQDLLRREADIAVRMARPEQEQLIARHIGRIELGLHATPEYLDKRGTPDSTGQLAEHALIGFDHATPFIRGAAKSVRGFDRERFAIRTDSDLAQLALIRFGAGIGICQAPIARRAARPLIRVLPDQFALQLDTWIAIHEGLRHNPSCKTTFDALAASARADGHGDAMIAPAGN